MFTLKIVRKDNGDTWLKKEMPRASWAAAYDRIFNYVATRKLRGCLIYFGHELLFDI